MQKKLIVLALASAFAAPAFAATSNVDIYGQLDVSVDYVSGLRCHSRHTSSGAVRVTMLGVFTATLPASA